MYASLVTFGFLPVIVFLIAGFLASKRGALLGALGTACAQMLFSFAGGGRDWLGLGGLAILAALVFRSIRDRDDFWFKIHGAVTDAISAIILLAGWFVFHRALLLDAAAATVGLDRLAALEPSLTAADVSETLRVMSLHLPFWLIAHALATVYAAANWGKWAWAAVRVPGFLAALMMASAFARSSAME